MKYYQMARQMVPDGAIIFQRSHELTELKTGFSLAKDFEEPFYAELDEELREGPLPTFFTSPALISTKQFYNDLREIGIDNLEVYPVIIKDEVAGRIIDDYILLNIIGRVSCANMVYSEYESIGDGMNMINKLVLDIQKTPRLDLFLVAEDTDCIVVSERVYSHLNNKGYTDIYFEELTQR